MQDYCQYHLHGLIGQGGGHATPEPEGGCGARDRRAERRPDDREVTAACDKGLCHPSACAQKRSLHKCQDVEVCSTQELHLLHAHLDNQWWCQHGDRSNPNAFKTTRPFSHASHATASLGRHGARSKHIPLSRCVAAALLRHTHLHNILARPVLKRRMRKATDADKLQMFQQYEAFLFDLDGAPCPQPAQRL